MSKLLKNGFQIVSEIEMLMVEGGYGKIDSAVIPPDWCEPHLPPPSGGQGNSCANR